MQIKKWMNFEKSAAEFLDENLRGLATVEHDGGHDSTVPDILVTSKNDNKSFYVEVKSTSAQSGQFVVMPLSDKKKFVFSEMNKTTENYNEKKMIEHLNKHWDKYSKVSTKGLDIDLPSDTLSSWITDYYVQKKVKFFISGDDMKNPVIIPVKQFSRAFSVTACLRKKRSGTAVLGKKAFETIKPLILKKDKNAYFDEEGKDTVVFSSKLDSSKSIKITEPSPMEFLLRPTGESEDKYVIRTRSSTNNPNIIFSITINPDFVGCGIKGITEELK